VPIVSISLLFNSRPRGNEGQQPTSRTAILLLSDILAGVICDRFN
jgi:hypothetical protein